MKLQLLFLWALVGPFCAFTHASPTSLPTDLSFATGTYVTSEATMTPEMFAVTSTAPATEPAATTEEVTTETVKEVIFTTQTDAPDDATTAVIELLSTVPPVVTESSPELDNTETPLLDRVAEKEMGEEELVVEGDTVEGLSSAQIIGIVIGALLAVVIVVAVVIAVVRKMGKYSP